MIEKTYKENYISVRNAANKLGIKTEIIQFHIDNGSIEAVNGMIAEAVCEMIHEQQNTYIGICSFMGKYDSDRFNSRYVTNRNKYIDFLEDNNYFGIEVIEPEDIYFDLPGREVFYVTMQDAQLLEYRSERFFREFGLTEYEKIKRIINSSREHALSTKYLRRYLAYMGNEEGIYTPSFTAFVEIIYDMLDLNRIRDEDIVSVISEVETVKTKELLVDFFRYVSRYENVKYHDVKLKKKESESIPAYSYEHFVKLAKILFNADYDLEHGLTNRALECSVYAELWLFLACHYICGWRAKDIVSRWIYPNLKSNDNPFGINLDSLKEDILDGVISNDIYDKVAIYVIKRIEMANAVPGKTGHGKLRVEIVPELRVFFGKLILIAEYHHITSGEGYMRANRTSWYGNWLVCKEFFGDDIFEITGKRSLSSRRLNKSYLQGLEHTARENGHTMLISHIIAAFARNHADIDTTAIYLKDHGLTGESAEVVLYMMMQRGVFGVSLYSALLAAFPDSFEKLSVKDQTALMEKIPLTAYEIETVGTALVASERITDEFVRGRKEEPSEILKTMFAVGQGKGKAKDIGIYCKRKALGYVCEYPRYESCIANLCPYHIFTSDGIPALVKVIEEYNEKATGNKKYSVALKTKIIPAFREIINELLKRMSQQDKDSVKLLIEEELNGQYITKN